MTRQILSCQLLLSLGLFLASAVCLPAFAGDPVTNVAPSASVKFGELDLNTDAGRRELLNRLRKAASLVCEDHGNIYPEVYRSCVQSTLAAAVDEIHHEQVSALFVASLRPNTR